MQHFGHVDDLRLGVALGSLLAEAETSAQSEGERAEGCDDQGCAV